MKYDQINQLCYRDITSIGGFERDTEFDAHLRPESIGFDFDGVLANQVKALVEWGRTHGFESTEADMTWRLDNWAPPELAARAMRMLLGTQKFTASFAPCAGILEAFDRAKRIGSVAVISSKRPVLHETTREWLARHGFEPDIVVFTDNKVEVADRLGLTAMVEDSPSHLRAFDKDLPRVRLFRPDYPYNRQSPGTTYAHADELFQRVRELAYV